MNWDRIQAEWTQFKGRAKQRWGKLTIDDLESSAGQREVLAGRLMEAYALSKQDAERQIGEWQRSLDAAEPHARAWSLIAPAPLYHRADQTVDRQLADEFTVTRARSSARAAATAVRLMAFSSSGRVPAEAECSHPCRSESNVPLAGEALASQKVK